MGTKYLNMDFNKVISTDEARATLDGPDGWASGWVLENQVTSPRYLRHQGGDGVMLWAGIIKDEVIGLIQVPEGVKLKGETYYDLQEKCFFKWWDKLSPQAQQKLSLSAG